MAYKKDDLFDQKITFPDSPDSTDEQIIMTLYEKEIIIKLRTCSKGHIPLKMHLP